MKEHKDHPKLDFFYYVAPFYYISKLDGDSDPKEDEMYAMLRDCRDYIKKCEPENYFKTLFSAFLGGYPDPAYLELSLIYHDRKRMMKAHYDKPFQKEPIVKRVDVEYEDFFEDEKSYKMYEKTREPDNGYIDDNEVHYKLILSLNTKPAQLENWLEETLEGHDYEKKGGVYTVTNSPLEKVEISETKIIFYPNKEFKVGHK
jgi:hypothetical protein